MKGHDSKTYYPFIDGLRALSILMVLVAHSSNFFQTHKLQGPFFKLITFLGPFGHLGVDMFFVLSGFLITGILLGDCSSEIKVFRFYQRRFFKIIPQYYILLFFTFCLGLFLQHVDFITRGMQVHEIASYMFFLQNYVSNYLLLDHLWSLSIEEHYYLIYPLLAAGIFKIYSNQETRRQVLLWTLSCLILLIIIYRDFLSSESLRLIVSSQYTHFRIDEILFGCVLKLWEPAFKNIKEQSQRILSCFLGFVGMCIYVYFGLSFDQSHVILCPFKHVLAYIASSSIFLSVYWGGPALKMVFENKQLIWIGKNSYAIYLWHYPLIFIFLWLVPRIGVVPAFFLFNITAIFAGYFATTTIERYFLGLRKRICP